MKARQRAPARGGAAVWPATFDDDWCGEGKQAGDMTEDLDDRGQAAT